MTRLKLALVALAGLLASCVAEFDTTPKQQNPTDPFAISVEEALDGMYDLMESLYGSGTRAASRRVASVEALKGSRLAPMTRCSMRELPENPYYLVNFANDEGFAILGGDRRLSSMLCVTESGSFTVSEAEQIAAQISTGNTEGPEPVWMSYEEMHNSNPENEGVPFDINDYNFDYEEGEQPDEPDLGEWVYPSATGDEFVKNILVNRIITEIDAIEEAMTRADTTGAASYDDDPCDDPDVPGDGPGGENLTVTESDWRDKNSTKIGPLLETKWDQGRPYNNACSFYTGITNVPAGCVAIALAQIIAFNEKPAASAYKTALLYPISSTWNELKSYDYSTYSPSSPLDAFEQRVIGDLSQIIYQIGRGVDMDYDSGGSSSSIGEAKRYLKSKGYSKVDKRKGYALGWIKTMLDGRGLPVYIRGQMNWEGHAWVIDGSMEQERYYIYTNDKGVFVRETLKETRYLLHCNWGWGGLADGYYFSDVFDPSKGPVTSESGVDSSTPGTGGIHFKRWMSLIQYKI